MGFCGRSSGAVGVCVMAAGVASLALSRPAYGQLDVLIPDGGVNNNVYWDQLFPVGQQPGTGDDVILRTGPDSFNILNLRSNAGLRNLTINSDAHLRLDTDNNSTLVHTGTFLHYLNGGNLTVDVPVWFTGADTHINGAGTISFGRDVTAWGHLRISGEPPTSDFGINFSRMDQTLTAQNLTLNSSPLHYFGQVLQVSTTVTIGDGISTIRRHWSDIHRGAGGEAEFTARTALTLNSLSLNADGTFVNRSADNSPITLHGLTLQGGRLEAPPERGYVVTAPVIHARPGRLVHTTNGTATTWESEITLTHASGQEPVAARLNLDGQNVEFRVEMDHGSLNALRVTLPISNGGIIKTGTGNMTLAGDYWHEQTSTVVHRGGLVMDTTPGGVALPGNATIGLGTGGPAEARLISNGPHQIMNDAVLTILSDGVWRRRGYEERIGGLVLSGGAVDGTFQAAESDALILAGNVSVLANSAGRSSSINGRTSLAGQTRTFHVERTPAAAVDLTLSASLEDGSLLKTGPGIMRLIGSGNSTLTRTRVNDGTLELGVNAWSNAVGSELFVGTANQSNGPIVRWRAFEQIPDNQTILFRSGLLDLNDWPETIGGINGSGTGSMSVRTGSGGVLNLQGGVTAFQGARIDFTGNIDLGHLPRTFDARGHASDSKFSNFSFGGGTISRGTFNKIGSGWVLFSSVDGDANLHVANGGATVIGARFSGIEGTGTIEVPFDVATAALTVDVPSGVTRTFTGALTGPGQFIKTGAGTQRLGGNDPGTLTGWTTVQAGTLELAKISGPAVRHLQIDPQGKVQPLRNNQLAGGASIVVAGAFDLNGTIQIADTVSIPGGRVSNGSLFTDGGVTVSGGTISNLDLFFVDSGGLVLQNQATVENVFGTIVGDSTAYANSVLSITQSNSNTPELIFDGELRLLTGSRVKLFPTVPDSPHALISVDGTFRVGTLDGSDYVGTTIIDLSGAGMLEEGTYRLIDFSNAPQGQGIASYTPLSQFETIHPLGVDGTFSISGNTLVYTVVPEPGTAGLIGIVAGLAMLRQRRHRGICVVG